MKNLIYIGLGGLIVYIFLKNRNKQILELGQEPKLNLPGKIKNAGLRMEQAIENSKFSIPDLSDRKQYQQEQKMCK